MVHAVLLVPLLPLAGYVLLAALGRRLGNPLAGWVATGLVGASFVATAVAFAGLFELSPARRSVTETWFRWLAVDRLHVSIGLLADPLSLTMAAFVTGVSTLIHLYSIGYMEHDRDFPKFFAYLNLFVASMLFLVLADSFLLTFIGWEGVGVCSYFLIAFWFERDSAASAGKKAMIFNRIGDVGFLLAMFLIFERTGSLDYTTVFARLGALGHDGATAAVLLLFLAAAGKSAQIPLYPWLADAMEGPTPVSALIHAATMVTAGVFLMVRVNPLLHAAPSAALVVASVGAATAFLGATIACAQDDIKKVLAYSTISQLGYMFLAAGVGAYVAAIFLMLAHAFYKALLFLGAGSVIHAMGEEQDIKRMGALARLMPLTATTFLVAWLAIGGVPPLAGFWAKGDVLLNAYGKSPALWAVGAVTAVLTAYYIGREYLLVFHGERRFELASEGAGHGAERAGGLSPHDPRLVMTVPLVVLAAASVLGGFVNLPFHPDFVLLSRWLRPVVGATELRLHLSVGTEWLFAVVDAVLALTGVGAAVRLWGSGAEHPAAEPELLRRAWYIDWAYDRYLAGGAIAFAGFLDRVVERGGIDGAVEGLGRLVRASGRALRRVQTGYVRNYALGLVAGLVLVLAYVLTRAGA
jgi:NADH-quinone oxidoreductase subunit L